MLTCFSKVIHFLDLAWKSNTQHWSSVPFSETKPQLNFLDVDPPASSWCNAPKKSLGQLISIWRYLLLLANCFKIESKGESGWTLQNDKRYIPLITRSLVLCPCRASFGSPNSRSDWTLFWLQLLRKEAFSTVWNSAVLSFLFNHSPCFSTKNSYH